MDDFISTQSKGDLLKIGLYQIITGLFGVSIFLWSVFETHAWTFLAIILTVVSLLIFGFSIVIGFLCLKGRALTLSLVNLGIQMVGFNIMGYGFRYAPGIFLNAGVDLTEGFKFSVNGGLSEIALNVNVQSEVIAIDFNVIAIIIFVWLDKVSRRIKSEREIRMDTRFL
jgi:hypothetical protein